MESFFKKVNHYTTSQHVNMDGPPQMLPNPWHRPKPRPMDGQAGRAQWLIQFRQTP